jgi:hypothetical protein
MPENLWPTDFGEVAQKTPVAILREQGQALGERTANVVVGSVSPRRADNDEFEYDFNLYSAPLGYNTWLFRIQHGIDLYPVRIVLPNEQHDATTPEEFTAQLRNLFARDKTKKTIASLIAQSKE